MIDITKKSYLKYFLFSSHYFSQGLLSSIATVIIPIYFLEKGISPGITTIVSGSFLIPWSLKFVWGGIADYFINFGRKKLVIIGGMVGAFGVFILGFINPVSALIPFAFFLFLSHCGASFLDISTDAWVIEISEENDRGKLNGAMMSSKFLGWAFGSFIFSLIVKFSGFSMAFFSAGLFVFLIIVFTFVVKEIRTIEKCQKIKSLFIAEFKKKHMQLIALFSSISAIGIGLVVAVVPLYMDINLHLDIVQIGLISMAFPLANIVGSVVSGIVTDKWGRKKSLYILFGTGAIFSASLIFADTWQILLIFYSIIGFTVGGLFVAECTLFMDVSNPKIAASHFGALTSLSNFGNMTGMMIAGSLILLLGFNRVFLYTGLLFGPPILILSLIKLKSQIGKV